VPSNPLRPLWRARRTGGTHRVAVLVTLGLTAAACTTTTAAKAPVEPRVLGQQKGTPAVVGQPAPAGTGQLDAVTCSGPTDCWAVGAPGATAAASSSTTSSAPPVPVVIDATVDGGKTWSAQAVTLTPAPALTGISCPSIRLCMAVGLSGTGTAGVVLTTNDAGATWAQAPVPTGALFVSSVMCAAATDCTAIASDDTSFWSAHSTDFGHTWTKEGNLPPGLLDAGNLSCVAGAACLVTGYTATAAGHGQGAIAISTDNGVTWAAATIPTGTGLLQDAVCATISSCLAVGTTSNTVSAVVPAKGELLTSDDGGHTWVSAAAGQPVDDMFGIDCPSRSTCVVVGTNWSGTPAIGTGAVARSTDGGATFAASATEYTPLALTSLSCPTAQRCVAVGGNTVARMTLPSTGSSSTGSSDTAGGRSHTPARSTFPFADPGS
jgi:photosystem II stability/assembly factor-like uncharacterized protein